MYELVKHFGFVDRNGEVLFLKDVRTEFQF